MRAPEPDICAPCAPLRIPDHPLPTVCVPSHPFAWTWLPPAEDWIKSADLRKPYPFQTEIPWPSPVRRFPLSSCKTVLLLSPLSGNLLPWHLSKGPPLRSVTHRKISPAHPAGSVLIIFHRLHCHGNLSESALTAGIFLLFGARRRKCAESFRAAK